MRKERLESAYKLYGVNKDLSNYFIFDMDTPEDLILFQKKTGLLIELP
jgi:hypothetical protein